jgi:hypothetical protein
LLTKSLAGALGCSKTTIGVIGKPISTSPYSPTPAAASGRGEISTRLMPASN